jgi:large conductance mechanosensitive channel
MFFQRKYGTFIRSRHRLSFGIKGAIMLDEFKKFMLRGNVLDLAVGVVIGGAFGAITKSLVDDILMPPIGLLTGGRDFGVHFLVLKAGTKAPPPYASLDAAKAAGANVLRYGVFLNTILTFLIVGLAMFAIVKTINKLRPPVVEPPKTKDCPQCCSAIPILAKRCPQCTSQLEEEAKPA